MLHDDVWLQLAKDKEILCDFCFRKRAVERGVEITLTSLKPCPFNFIGYPDCKFNKYAKGDKEITLDKEWIRQAMRSGYQDSEDLHESSIGRLCRMDAFLLATIGSLIATIREMARSSDDLSSQLSNHYNQKLRVSFEQTNMLTRLAQYPVHVAPIEHWMEMCCHIVDVLDIQE
jgi:hypothetical protein